MTTKILSPDQIEQFMEEGYTLLPDAFPRSVAEAVKRAIVAKAGANVDDPATWTKPYIHLQETYTGEPFSLARTQRLSDAVDELMGAGRWTTYPQMGWWPVLFPGFHSGPWVAPETGWHIDGSFFHHHLHSREQGLLPIFLFSDIGPGDGGTAIAPGSHKICARLLRDAEPAGLSANDLSKAVAAVPRKPIEVHGQAGDVALLHPFMLHAISKNTGKNIRVICNPFISFNEPMNVTGDSSRPLSVVEESIVRALAPVTA